MTESCFNLDYIADTALNEQDSWRASRLLGDMTLAYIQAESADGRSACYQLENVDALIVGISEQPDLHGPVLVELGAATGTFIEDRSLATSYSETAASPKVEGQFIALNVRHQATYESLLRAALPTEDTTIALLRDGYSVASSYPRHSFVHTLEKYAPDEIMLNPRRVQAAALLMRCISEQQIAEGDPQAMTLEENEAFLDEFFPYQDVALTGGGGKTVRMRAPRPLK